MILNICEKRLSQCLVPVFQGQKQECCKKEVYVKNYSLMQQTITKCCKPQVIMLKIITVTITNIIILLWSRAANLCSIKTMNMYYEKF